MNNISKKIFIKPLKNIHVELPSCTNESVILKHTIQITMLICDHNYNYYFTIFNFIKKIHKIHITIIIKNRYL